jgi:hypothetical protein
MNKPIMITLIGLSVFTCAIDCLAWWQDAIVIQEAYNDALYPFDPVVSVTRRNNNSLSEENIEPCIDVWFVYAMKDAEDTESNLWISLYSMNMTNPKNF